MMRKIGIALALALALVLSLVAVEAAKFPVKLVVGDRQCNSTSSNAFSCCGRFDFNLDFPFKGPIHFDDAVCGSLVVDPKTQNATVTLTINGEVRRNDTVPIKDLATVCAPIPFDVDVCLNWTNIVWNSFSRRLTGCADIAAVVTSITVYDVKLGCFDLHSRAL